MLAVDFEVYGRVQGVSFRRHAVGKAKELGLTGWVKNTAHGSVIGHMEGSPNRVHDMKYWLRHVGSPKSTIRRTEFRNERPISGHSSPTFIIKK